jgi:putative hydrolase of the HAD superfamily
MSRYRDIFFDLDHTLWDFQANSRATLIELHGEMDLAGRGITDTDLFVSTYEEINEQLWGRLGKGGMKKEVLRVLRFRNTLGAFGLRDDHLARELGHRYLERCPRRTLLVPGAQPLVESLANSHRLHIITNGFHEVQQVKLRECGLRPHFNVVLTSEQAGCRKPDPVIFHKALGLAGARVENSLMVGDSAAADMAGARAAGMDHAHLHRDVPPDPEATYRLSCLDELADIVLR